MPIERDTLITLGEQALSRWDAESAAAYFQQAIAQLPAFFTSGLSLKQYRKEQVSLVPAYLGLAKAMQQLNQPAETLNLLLHAFKIAPEDLLVHQTFATSARWMEVDVYNETLKQTLLFLLQSPKIDPQDLALLSWSLWQLTPPEHKHWEDPLLLTLIKKTLVPKRAFERLCLDLRSLLLEGKIHSISVAEAIALHFHYSEYIEPIEPIHALNQLQAQPLDPHFRVALLTAYGQPVLEQLSECETLFPELVQELITFPAQEQVLKSTLSSFGRISDHTSQRVQEQYEEYPYPRWRQLTQQAPKPFPIALKQLLPEGAWSSLPDSPSILIAGCGTGSHILKTTQSYFYQSILALDLSLSSLAYAKRKVDEAQLHSVEWIQMDLLDLPELHREFDLIESVGVLHHMQKPLDGLKALKKCLRPSGLMQIGLYSRAARRDLAEARQLLQWKGEALSLEEMRLARQRLFELPDDHPAKPVTYSLDFYSASGLRDLIFHTQEQDFNLLEIQEMLSEVDLEWVGFEWSHPRAPRLYRHRFPDDPKQSSLLHWHQLEQEHPDIFMGMYLFWVRKCSD